VTAAAPGRGDLTRVAVALGSNLGDRHAHLTWAVGRLRALLTDLRVSPFEDTAPVDVLEPQPRYLNAVAVGTTRRSPNEILDALLAIEEERGRVRVGVRAARTLDLDLILHGNTVIEAPDLVVPHPRFRERAFVLGPLAALAPRWRDPVTGRTLAALWRTHRLPGRG
jgi:2-amino-4-hydroxy-6-hydroxymethyldihydropteridine diphosphokinase